MNVVIEPNFEVFLAPGHPAFLFLMIGAGSTGGVELSATSSPAGIAATFDPPTVPNYGGSVMTLTCTEVIANGTYVAVTATAGDGSTGTASVEVNPNSSSDPAANHWPTLNPIVAAYTIGCMPEAWDLPRTVTANLAGPPIGFALSICLSDSAGGGFRGPITIPAGRRSGQTTWFPGPPGPHLLSGVGTIVDPADAQELSTQIYIIDPSPIAVSVR